MSNERLIGDILKQFVQTKPIKDKYLLVQAKGIWKSALGPTIDQYTTGIELRRGLLTVSLSSAPLKQELLFGKVKLITLLNEGLGGQYIKDIRFI